MSKKLSARHLKQLSREIDPDEIFLDSRNLPSFDKDQFEGRIEQSIGRTAIWSVLIVFIIIALAFSVKIYNLQFIHGEELFAKSERNRLSKTPIFAMRGIVYDHNKVPLAWNSYDDESAKLAFIMSETSTTTEKMPFPHRSYISSPGFGHILGYVSYPKRDSKGNFYQEAFVGKDGLEEYYNELLSGENGVQIFETDALGNVHSGSIVEEPQNGEVLSLSIDSRIQEKLHTAIRDLANNTGYMAGAGAIMDIHTGELLAMTSYPEYESSVLSEGKDRKKIQGYNLDKRAVFLDRAVSGIYTPGSIIKPFIAIAALSEGVISPKKEILSSGSISIQNPYNPEIKTVFRDWKVHGWTDMRHAIAVSSDVYFYAIGGGYEGQRGIGIENIEKYTRLFGFGSSTGIDITDEKIGTIPSPEWKAKMFKGEAWRLGDTYHTVIGQYGFQATILQALRGIAGIANGGTLVTPHLLMTPEKEFPKTQISIPEEYLVVARDGMRQAVREGTVTGLNVGYVTVAGKTGTAEIDSGKKYINSWVVGFFPYEKPKYAFAVVMEKGPYANDLGGVFVMRQVLDWMNSNSKEYLENF